MTARRDALEIGEHPLVTVKIATRSLRWSWTNPRSRLPDSWLSPDVLVIGAGPTGLVLAYWLKRLGMRVRIVDKTSEPGTTSRALGVQARTLEFYKQVGLADALIDAWSGIRRRQPVGARRQGRRAPRSATMGAGPQSRIPYMLIFPQDEHERLLIERLAEAGVHVERRTELLSLRRSATGGSSRAYADRTAERRICEARYLAGCDGARSTVRRCTRDRLPRRDL